MKKAITLILALAITLSCAGCAGSVTSKNVTELTGDTAVNATTLGSDTVQNSDLDGSALRQMGLELLSRAEGDNPVISPLSAYLCLAMEANGADGVTAQEFSTVLGGNVESLNVFSKSIADELKSSEDQGAIFRIANSAWVDMDANILDDYLAAIVAYYDAQCYTAPLDTKEAMNSMNEWVKEHTEGMIPTVFDNPLTEDTMLVLINTVYMKAQWLTEFKKEGTSKDTFHKLDGDTKVNFMHRTAGYGYAAGEGYESVKLSYKSDNLAFIAIKPTDGTARELLSSLTSESLNEIINSMESQKVRLSIPKFTIDYSMELNDPLSDMGLSSLFDAGTADLSLMGTGEDGMPLYVSRIFQKVKIIVDEKGTEAAAATVSETNTTAAAPTEEPIEMKLDEPFIYAIIETEYNTPVFIGIMDDPA